MTHRRNWVIASSRVGRGNLGIDLELSEPEPWMLDGLCAQVDPDLWFPEKGCSTRPAKLICAGCPVQAECLEYAMARDERFGVYGGLSERDRRRYKATGELPKVRKDRVAKPLSDGRVCPCALFDDPPDPLRCELDYHPPGETDGVCLARLDGNGDCTRKGGHHDDDSGLWIPTTSGDHSEAAS